MSSSPSPRANLNGKTAAMTIRAFGDIRFIRPSRIAGSAMAAGLILVAPARADVIIDGISQPDPFTVTSDIHATSEVVGTTTNGTFNQSGFTNSVTEVLLGAAPGVHGTYNLSGTGALEVGSGQLALGSTNGGGGTFNLQGGTVTLVGGVGYLGVTSADGTAAFNQTGGTLDAGDRTIYVGGGPSGYGGTYTQNGGTAKATLLEVGMGAGTGTYDLKGGILTSSDLGNPLQIYVHTPGTFKFDGGTLNFGSGAAPQGSLNIVGGRVVASGDEVLEQSSASSVYAVNHSSGTNDVTGTLYVGRYAGNTGTYNLSGTGAVNAGGLTVGGGAAGGVGTFNLQGGTLNAGTIQVNDNGTVLFDGGTAYFSTLNIAGGNVGNPSEFATEVLDGPSATPRSYAVNQTGGDNLVGRVGIPGRTPATDDYFGSIVLGANANNTGTYNLSNGVLATGQERIGDSGAGIVNQTGGANRISGGGTNGTEGGLYLGWSAGGAGAYNLSGGLLDATNTLADVVGLQGSGAFNQTGGTFNAGHLDVGFAAGSSGAYNLSGDGSLLNAAYETVGVESGTTGTFTQTGGANIISATLAVADNSGSAGAYDLKGGTLSARTVVINAGGAFTLEGGTVNVGSGGFGNGGQLAVRGAGGTINGSVTNNGTVRVDHTAVTFNGDFTNSGAYVSDPSTQSFTNLTVTPTGYIQAAAGDKYVVSGNFTNNSTQNAEWDTSKAELQFVTGTGISPNLHFVAAAGADLGANAPGFLDNFAWGTIDATGQYLAVTDGRSDATAAALYVYDLLGAVVDTSVADEIDGLLAISNIFSSLNIYYDVTEDPALGGLDYGLLGGGELIAVDLPVIDAAPEPSSLGLLLAGLAAISGFGAPRARPGRRAT